MGGYSFKVKDIEIFYMNLPMRILWKELMDSMDNRQSLNEARLGCLRDPDGQCAKHGCLKDPAEEFLFSVQDGQLVAQIVQALNAGTIPPELRAAFSDNDITLSDPASLKVVTPNAEWRITDQEGAFIIRLEDETLNTYAEEEELLAGERLNRRKLIQSIKKALRYLKENPDWESGLESKWQSGKTDREVAIEMLTDFLEVLQKEESEEIHMLDRFFDTDVNPCPRFLPMIVNGVIKLFARGLPYEQAKEMKETGEWDRILSEVMEKGEWTDESWKL